MRQKCGLTRLAPELGNPQEPERPDMSQTIAVERGGSQDVKTGLNLIDTHWKSERSEHVSDQCFGSRRV